MKRPLLFILSFLIFGILIGIYIKNLFIICFLFIVIFSISLYFSKRYRIKACNWLWLFSILGYIVMSFNCNLSILENKILSQENINATGIIKDINQLKNGDFNVKIKVNQIRIKDEIINKSFYISSYMKYDKLIKVGYKINFSGKFTLGDEQRNPNQFNEQLTLKSNGIDFKVYINKYEILNLTDKFSYYIHNLTNKIGDIYDKILPEQESAILKAILLGNKDFLKDDMKELYRKAGIYHILAISGLHIGILVLFLNKIFSRLNKKYSKLIIIIILILYCILTGASISTIRATFMYFVMLIGAMFYKDYDMLSSVSLSAIILLLINPYNLFNVGFLFSYICVFSIGFLGTNFVKRYNLHGIKASLVISFFISLAIKPISAYYFYTFNIIDFLLNLIVVPFTFVIVLMGFLVTIIGIISIPLAEFFVGIVYYIFRFFTFICKIIDNIGFANINVERPSPFFILCFYIMLVLIGYYLYEKNLVKKRQKFMFIGILIFLIGIGTEILRWEKLTITMLDVGQGDCIIGQKGNDTFIIDGGGGFSKNVGNDIIIPYLDSRGIDEIDFVFISHMDSDHMDGILDIIGKIEIENIFVSKVHSKEKNYYKLLNNINKNKINLYELEKGDKLTLGNNINFEIIYPSHQVKSYDENNNSLVMTMEYMGNTVLFTGDIEKEVEKLILNDINDVDILKVAHHGSKTSTTKDFFNAVTPEVSLISCGVNNIYKHPSNETLQTLKNTKIFRTDEDGAITIKFYRDKYKIKTILQ